MTCAPLAYCCLSRFAFLSKEDVAQLCNLSAFPSLRLYVQPGGNAYEQQTGLTAKVASALRGVTCTGSDLGLARCCFVDLRGDVVGCCWYNCTRAPPTSTAFWTRGEMPSTWEPAPAGEQPLAHH